MSTLTQRYVSAAVAGVPDGQRHDVQAELAASVADAVDALVASGLPVDQAERQAITDLGDPAVLAEQFGGRPRHLIGAAYYPAYWQLLKTLELVVVPIVGAATLLAQGLVGTSIIETVLGSVGAMFQVGVQLAFWVTLVFAVLERTHTPVPVREWTPDDLPEPTEQRISLGDTVFGVAMLTVLLWAMIWQRDHWLVDSQPVLNPDAWVPWMLLLTVVLLASIVVEIVKYRIGRWTVALAVLNTVLNLVFAGIVVWLWQTGSLFSTPVTDAVPAALLSALPWIVVLIAAADTVEGWWKLIRQAGAGIPSTP